MFGRGWEPAEATIVEAELVPVHKGDRYSHEVYVVEVRPAGQAPFRAKLAQPETGPQFAFPKRGHVIGVKCRPKSQQVKWDHSDPRSFNTKQVDDKQAKLDAALKCTHQLAATQDSVERHLREHSAWSRLSACPRGAAPKICPVTPLLRTSLTRSGPAVISPRPTAACTGETRSRSPSRCRLPTSRTPLRGRWSVTIFPRLSTPAAPQRQ